MTAEIVVDLHGYSGLGAEFVKGEVTSTGMRITIRGALAEALHQQVAFEREACASLADFFGHKEKSSDISRAGLCWNIRDAIRDRARGDALDEMAEHDRAILASGEQ